MKVEFSMLGVPKNWSNFMRNRYVVYEEKDEWVRSTTILGRVARVKAGRDVAEKGHPLRMVHLHQIRTRLLDKDGLFISNKPIVDGLKTWLRRKVDGEFTQVPGAGLIFNDDPKHCDWNCTQELAGGRDQKITITVEIEDKEAERV